MIKQFTFCSCSQMYKTLAGLQTEGRSEDELNTSQVSQHGELLDKAKYALFATMDSIEDKPNHVSWTKEKTFFSSSLEK